MTTDHPAIGLHIVLWTIASLGAYFSMGGKCSCVTPLLCSERQSWLAFADLWTIARQLSVDLKRGDPALFP
ncbi:hypothetical protein BD414DRAFT_492482 [Trametes punicea]|nr:hypothetical protein BD414DRAFT_492482 [Trametes punicea]